MRAGLLRHRIEIQAQTTEQDSFGQQKSVWRPVWNCWAAIDVVASQLKYETAQFVSNVTHKITIRYTKVPVSVSNRVVFGAHVYEVKAVLNPEQRNRELQLICYEINPKE